MAWRDISTAPIDGSWVVLRFEDYADEPKVSAGFYGDDGDGGFDWYGSEAASSSLAAFYGQPIAWLPLDGEG